jgi:hypothetical protein
MVENCVAMYPYLKRRNHLVIWEVNGDIIAPEHLAVERDTCGAGAVVFNRVIPPLLVVPKNWVTIR